MLIFFIVSILLYFSGSFSFCLKRKHLLMLEVVVLGSYLMLYSHLIFHGYEYYFSIIFLTVSVCEGVLGLFLLVSLVRIHGNNYFQSFNVLWWGIILFFLFVIPISFMGGFWVNNICCFVLFFSVFLWF